MFGAYIPQSRAFWQSVWACGYQQLKSFAVRARARVLYQRVLTSPDYCWHHGAYKILINCSNIAEKDCRGTGHS